MLSTDINREEDHQVEGTSKQDTIPSNNQFSPEVMSDGDVGNLTFQSITRETHLSVVLLWEPLLL